jgi:ubiquitin C-terminal hydrolase
VSCLDTFDREENLLSLAVEVYDLNSLKDALDNFVKQETVENDCVNCGKNAKKYKRITCGELPPVLIIYLKKYLYLSSRVKLTHQVNYNEYLDASPYMTSHFTNSNNEKQQTNLSNNLYKLYGVINHVGEDPYHGHYYSYIRSSDNRWFSVNDEYCRTVPSNEVFNHRDAYVLFYGRVFNTYDINNSSCQQQQSTSLMTESNPVHSLTSTINSSV